MTNKQEKQSDYFFKITMAGSPSTGKSCIVYYFIKQTTLTNSQTTVGVEFCPKTMIINDKTVKLAIWDTAGQERFNAITKMYYKSSAAVILVYDITQEATFEKTKVKLNQIRQVLGDNVLIALVGNKIDLQHERKVKKQQGLKFAKENSLRFFQTSAMEGTNIDTIFNCLTEQLVRLKQQQQNKKSTVPNSKPVVTLQDNNTLQKSGLSHLQKSKMGKSKPGGCC